MAFVDKDIEFTQGDDVVRLYSWKLKADGSTVVITGRTYRAQIRTNPDATTYWSFTPSVNGPAGQLTLTMLMAVTAGIPPGRWYWDMEETVSGVESVVLGGRVTVRPRITR